jgi:hypothetical protein
MNMLQSTWTYNNILYFYNDTKLFIISYKTQKLIIKTWNLL